jgi:hypothetical protein
VHGATTNPHTYIHTHPYIYIRLEVILGRGLTKETLAEADRLVVILITTGEEVVGPKWVRHNTHSLLELVRSSLVATMNANRGATGEFEKFHEWGKRGGRGLPTVKAENFALSSWVAKDAFVSALHGCEWGPKAEFCLGTGFFTLRDWRSGKEHLSHPVIRALMDGESVLRSSTVQDNGLETVKATNGGGWEVAGQHQLVQRQRELDNKNDEVLTVAEREAMVASAKKWGKETDVDCDAKSIRCVELKSGVIQTVANTGRIEIVRPGDDVELLYKGSKEHCTVERIIALVDGSRCTIWLFVLWFYNIGIGGSRKLGEKARTKQDPFTRAGIVNRELPGSNDNFMPIPVRMLVQRVHVQHHCQVIEEAKSRKHIWNAADVRANSKHPKKCAVRRTCVTHMDHKCKSLACVADFQQWVSMLCHHESYRDGSKVKFAIFSEEQGFRPRRHREGGHEDDVEDDTSTVDDAT